jgi:hypothetical protein
MRHSHMSIQELETQLLKLDRADRVHMLQILEQSLQTKLPEPPTQAVQNLADFFRNSPLAEAIASGELDLTRDQTIEPDRVTF